MFLNFALPRMGERERESLWCGKRQEEEEERKSQNLQGQVPGLDQAWLPSRQNSGPCLPSCVNWIKMQIRCPGTTSRAANRWGLVPLRSRFKVLSGELLPLSHVWPEYSLSTTATTSQLINHERERLTLIIFLSPWATQCKPPLMYHTDVLIGGDKWTIRVKASSSTTISTWGYDLDSMTLFFPPESRLVGGLNFDHHHPAWHNRPLRVPMCCLFVRVGIIEPWISQNIHAHTRHLASWLHRSRERRRGIRHPRDSLKMEPVDSGANWIKRTIRRCVCKETFKIW